MSIDPLMRHIDMWFEALFPLEPAPALQQVQEDEDSPLALDERTTRVLSNGDVLEFDVRQEGAQLWTAKDANHDGRTGVDDTRELAIADLVSMAEDDLEDCDVEDL